MKQAPPTAHRLAAPRPSQREWAIVALLLVAALLLRLDQLDTPSYTWDEVTDRELAWSYLTQGNLSLAEREPSQARLPIYLEALVIKYWGDSEVKLRSISVIAGLASLLVVWHIGRQVFNAEAGIGAMALATFSPFHLTISRLSGTHSDAVFALFYTLALWLLLEFWASWKRQAYGRFETRTIYRLLLSGMVAGIATGSKLTGVLFNANLLLVASAGRRNWRHNLPWVLLNSVLWLMSFLLTSPIYLHPENIIAAWQDQQMNWQQIRGYQFLGNTYETLPLWYWLAVIPIKFTIPVAVAGGFQVLWMLTHWQSTSAQQKVLLFNLFPLVILITRHWQSPTYAALLIGPFYAMAAQSLTQLFHIIQNSWQTSKPHIGRVLAALGLALVIGENLRVLTITHPDYLMTGYDFGDAVIGQFWGPAVYHCQGAGQALAYLSTQPPGIILAPQACTGPIAYYHTVYALPDIIFQSQLVAPEDVRDYRYVIFPYTITYMTTPYPLRQQTTNLREGVARYCHKLYSYDVGKRELFWVYQCQP